MSKAINSITIIKGEGLAQSVLSDMVTGAMLVACIWFSHWTGCVIWEFACMGIFLIWLGSKTPFASNRILRINSKREAIDWAAALPDDGSADPTPADQPKLFAKASGHLASLIARLKSYLYFDDPFEEVIRSSMRANQLMNEWRAADKARCERLDEIPFGNKQKPQIGIPFGWREVIERARDSIGGGSYSEIRQYELSIVGPYLDGLADEFEHLQEVCEAVGQLGLPPVYGDVLPQIGDKVLIHLGRADQWVEHKVVGYYVWKDLGRDDSQHRVFVRVKSKDGYLNARMLKDVRPATAQKVGAV